MAQDLNTSGWRRWMRPPLALLLAALLVLVLLAGLVVATQRPTLGAASGGELTQRTWTLTRLAVDGREQPLAPGHVPTMFFGRRPGQVDGDMGCNSYMGTYTLAGETLHFSKIFFTLRGCFPPYIPLALEEQEDAYSAALPRVAHYHLQSNTLLLISADGRLQFTFRAT